MNVYQALVSIFTAYSTYSQKMTGRKALTLSLFTSSIWHELHIILYNQENMLLTQAVHLFMWEECNFVDGVCMNWGRIVEQVEGMLLE